MSDNPERVNHAFALRAVLYFQRFVVNAAAYPDNYNRYASKKINIFVVAGYFGASLRANRTFIYAG